MARAKNIGTMFAELAVKDKMSAGMKYARTQIKGVQKELGALGATYAKFGTIAAAGISVAGIGKAMKAAADMEVLETQFAALLKSEDQAIKLIEKLRKMNVESPLGVEDFSKGAKQLLGVRMSADDAAVALDKLSNISMGNAENFDSLVRAFAQTRSAGRLMGQEVLQFVNAGFNPLSEISIKTGESMAALKKRMEDGKISFQEVEEAITSATAAGGLFNGMNAKMAATMEGKMQKLKDNFNQFFIALGKPINETLKPELDKLNNYDFSTLGKNLGDNIAEAMRGLTDGMSWRIWSLKGFASIADVGSSIQNVFEAAANSLFDKLTGTGKGSFGEDMIGWFDYLQKKGGTDFAKSLRKDAETLEKENARRFKNQRREQILGGRLDGAAAADSVFGELFKELDKPKPTVPAVPVEIEKTAATEKAFDFQASKFELGQGPRAGLSLNADGGASTVKRGIDYLARIADILNTAKIQDKQLVWS